MPDPCASCAGTGARFGTVMIFGPFASRVRLRFGPAGAPREAIRLWLTHATPPPLAWQATEFHLVESTLGHEGANYAPIASYALG